ncbi:CheR family methyltransferase [Amaricoccus macauensis]|uniref:CheR family methyltransferase n=1 Tax=Amaricoccus macauensis TaxID=57001 RepID=UPI003C7BB7F8
MTTDPRFIIGIASSAGGLEALTQLVQNLPADSGASYVIAQHMSPTHKSLMSTLIGREANMDVIEMSDPVKPASNTIYVTPPNWDVVLQDSLLTLVPPHGEARTPKPSGDRLFMSLARERGETCMGIVLSGTGSDGSYGVQAIREAGGITIAQDLGTAKYDGMPASAAETGCIDLVLSPTQIGQHLGKILSSPRDFEGLRTITESHNKMSDLLHILLARTRVDFREYKESTVHRRIQRRMMALGIDAYEDYVAHCRSDVNEVDALFKDLLISVTRFFRDEKQFDCLRDAIADVVEQNTEGPIRMWVAGCATGEEAYTIAILVAEAMGGIENISKERLQVFATDIDLGALELARIGSYPQSAANDIPREYLEQYFDIADGKIHVKPRLKNVIRFTTHNVFQDPPFINIDLVSLRNLLIYFKPRLQERVLNRIHYALKQHGLLFLGTSESIGALNVDFEAVSEPNKLFSKRRIARNTVRSSFGDRPSEIIPWKPVQTPAPAPDSGGLQKEMFDALARSIAPNALLVTANQDIIRIYGEMSDFIEMSEKTRLDLKLTLLKSPLRDEAPSLCGVALRRGARRPGMQHRMDGTDYTHVQMEAYPISIADEHERYVLLAFVKSSPETPEISYESLPQDAQDKLVRQLHSEILSTREALQQSIEELQTSNEELQSVNEELQSTNEELQASNEELETANEELQSTNEELVTVNEELQVNSSELKEVTGELTSVLQSAPSSILVVDNALQIVRASQNAQYTFKLPERSATRMHLSQASVPHGYPSLTHIANETFRLRENQEHQFTCGQKLVSLKSAPFFDENMALRGITMIFSEYDVYEENLLREELTMRARLVESIDNVAHFKHDLRSNTLSWSEKMFKIFGLPETQKEPTPEQVEGFFDPSDSETVRKAIDQSMKTGWPYRFNRKLRRPEGELIEVEIFGGPVRDDSGSIVANVGAIRVLEEPGGSLSTNQKNGQKALSS